MGGWEAVDGGATRRTAHARVHREAAVFTLPNSWTRPKANLSPAVYDGPTCRSLKSCAIHTIEPGGSGVTHAPRSVRTHIASA
eukprot:scaffold42254_cov65-Phaeocystis_antarctica.AAC.5